MFHKKSIFLYVLDRFDALILKIILKKIKKYHFDIFQHEKHFKKQSQPHFQSGFKILSLMNIAGSSSCHVKNKKWRACKSQNLNARASYGQRAQSWSHIIFAAKAVNVLISSMFSPFSDFFPVASYPLMSPKSLLTLHERGGYYYNYCSIWIANITYLHSFRV